VRLQNTDVYTSGVIAAPATNHFSAYIMFRMSNFQAGTDVFMFAFGGLIKLYRSNSGIKISWDGGVGEISLTAAISDNTWVILKLIKSGTGIVATVYRDNAARITGSIASANNVPLAELYFTTRQANSANGTTLILDIAAIVINDATDSVALQNQITDEMATIAAWTGSDNFSTGAATASDINSGTNSEKYVTPAALAASKYQAIEPVDLTDAATIATDAALGNVFRVTIAGNRTLGNPTNAVDGQVADWEIKQDATGSRSLALGSKFILPAGAAAFVATTTAGAVDIITARYSQSADKWRILEILKGFAN
ncbi:MAG TPA: hypothetical protein VF692_03620, partial [Pyrinomonadaceae bacterium]